jgi:F0F1-type ATP synthase assembly protein I
MRVHAGFAVAILLPLLVCWLLVLLLQVLLLVVLAATIDAVLL